MLRTLDERIAAYIPLVNKVAQPLTGMARAEFDDLVQEGLISVWRALRLNKYPSEEVIRYRMITWIRYLNRHCIDYIDMEALDELFAA